MGWAMGKYIGLKVKTPVIEPQKDSTEKLDTEHLIPNMPHSCHY